MAKKKSEKGNKQIEQSIWTVRVNSQLLYKKPINGRTILLGMTAEENKKVEEIMDKAIEDLAKALKKRTTIHKAPEKKEQVTRVDASKPEISEEETTEEPTASKSRVARGPDGKFVSKSTSETEGDVKKNL